MAKNIINKIDFDFNNLGHMKVRKNLNSFLDIVNMDVRNVLIVDKCYFVKDNSVYTTSSNVTFNGDFELLAINKTTKSEEILNVALDIFELLTEKGLSSFHLWDFKLEKYVFIEKKEVKNNLFN